jgi:hypothetical protein
VVKNHLETGIVVTLVLTLLISLIPLVAIAFYAHPSADDYSYGLKTSQVWNDTHSFTKVLGAAIDQAQGVFISWQGTYCGVFAMSLQPGVFGERKYVIGVLVIIAMLVLGTFLLLKTVLIDCLKAKWPHFWIIFSVISIMTIQFMYSPSEGFYWFNGGILYTGFYSISLAFFSVIFSMITVRKSVIKGVLAFAAAFLAIVVSSGNYATALTSLLALVCVVSCLILKKNRNFWLVSGILCIQAVFFLLTINAPGNAVRQGGVHNDPNPILAITQSLAYGAYSIANSTTLPAIIGWMAILPIIFQLARRTEFDFNYPLLVLAISFGIYSAQGTPCFYALGMKLPKRLIDIIYYSYYPLVGFNLFYTCGYIAKKMRKNEHIRKAVDFSEGVLRKHLLAFSIVMCSLFVFGTMGLCKVEKGKDAEAVFSHLPTSVSAAVSLFGGEAERFDKEEALRLAVYEDRSITDALIEEHESKPEFLFHTDISHDEKEWQNIAIAQYFGKKSVRLR